jgi:alanyl-tRNA synthetase
VRRIEALTGRHAVSAVREREILLTQAAATLKASPETVRDRAEQLLAQLKDRDRQIEALQRKLTEASSSDESITEVADIQALTRRDDGLDVPAMRNLSDRVRDKLGSGAGLLASVNDGRVQLLCVVTKDITGRLKAGDLMREVAPMVGGKGGGRPDMAQGGGDDVDSLDKALAAFPELVAKHLG